MGSPHQTRIDKRLAALWESFKASGKARAATFGLTGIVGWWVLVVLAQHLADTWIGKGAAAILGFVRFLAFQPLGMGLVFILLVVAAVLIWAAWDTRDRPRPTGLQQDKVDAPLSADEKDAITRIRTLWYHESGQDTVLLLLRLFEEVKQQLGDKYYAPYFEATYAGLKDAGKALETALDIDQGTPLDSIVQAFNALFAAYLRSADLLYQAHQSHDVSLSVEPPLRWYWLFRKSHGAFRDRLIQATEYPGINRRLAVFANPAVGRLPSRQFLGEQPWDGEGPPQDGAAGEA